jgi:hypothetical protein
VIVWSTRQASFVVRDLTREETLEELQDNKLTLVCEKLDLQLWLGHPRHPRRQELRLPGYWRYPRPGADYVCY